MPYKPVDKDKLEQLANRSYENSIDKYIEKNKDYIDADLEPFIVQMYTIAKTMDEKNAKNVQTSGTLATEWRMTVKELHTLVQREKQAQEETRKLAELESQVDPDAEALGDFI